jgi:hypothetical protein
MIALIAGLRRSRHKFSYALSVLILAALGWGLVTADQARRIARRLSLRGFGG